MALLELQETWRERQARVEENLKQLEQQGADFSVPVVVMNPYEIAPYTAMILFETEAETAVTAVVSETESGEVVLQYICLAQKQHRIPVYGLCAGTAFTVTLIQENGAQTAVSLPIIADGVPNGQAAGALAEGEWIFTVPLAGEDAYPCAYDGNGVCRWYLTESLAFQWSKSANGRILTCGPALLSPPYSATSILEMDLLGKVYKEYRVPGGICNGFAELEDGSLLALHQEFNRGTASDMCILIDRTSGEVLKTWDLRALLPINKGAAASASGSDWFHGAAVDFDKASNAILIAGANRDVVVSLDFESGAINWMLGDPLGWPEDLVQQYFLKPEGDNFMWSYVVNDVAALDEQQILCFDNGYLRAKKGADPMPLAERFSRVVCYQIDAQNKNVRQVWEHGAAEKDALYSPYLSNCAVYGDGVLMNFGGIGKLNGVAAERPAYFMLKDNPQIQLQTQIMLRKEDKTVYQLQLPINCYDAKKLSVASLCHTQDAAEGIVLGQRYGNDVLELELALEDGGQIAEKYQLSAYQTKEQVILSATFYQGEMVVLLLDGENGSIPYYMQTTRSPYLTESFQTYAKGSERPIVFAVSTEPLSGQYEICVGINDQKYHTGIKFEC